MLEKGKGVTSKELKALIKSQKGEFIIHVEIEKEEKIIAGKSGGKD